MRIWQFLLSACLVLAAGLGLLALSGGARGLFAPPLQAELVVQDFPVPDGFGIDPDRVAGFMADQLQKRMNDDVAIRLMLKSDTLKKVQTIVLPRLMNVVVVQSMMHDIPELSAILELANFRRSVTGTIRSAADAEDVALTVPGALLAQVDGTKVSVATTSTGLTALQLGKMTAGQTHQVVVWLDASSLKADMGASVKLGAANGQRGRVLMWGDHGWFGADAEALRWVRWLVGGILGGTLLFGLASLFIPLLTARQARARARN
jgi:hypothetical protein